VSAENDDLLRGPLTACLSIGRLGGRDVDTDTDTHMLIRSVVARQGRGCASGVSSSWKRAMSIAVVLFEGCWKEAAENLPERESLV
jgi:hypothetical protein